MPVVEHRRSVPSTTLLLRSSKLIVGKVVPLHAMDGAWGARRYSSYSLIISTLEGVSGQHHAPAALYSRGKSPRYPLYRRLGGPQSRSGRRG
jgi:hypothetical protein